MVCNWIPQLHALWTNLLMHNYRIWLDLFTCLFFCRWLQNYLIYLLEVKAKNYVLKKLFTDHNADNQVKVARISSHPGTCSKLLWDGILGWNGVEVVMHPGMHPGIWAKIPRMPRMPRMRGGFLRVLSNHILTSSHLCEPVYYTFNMFPPLSNEGGFVHCHLIRSVQMLEGSGTLLAQLAQQLIG